MKPVANRPAARAGPLGRSQAVASRTPPSRPQMRMIHLTLFPVVPMRRTMAGETMLVIILPMVRATAYQPASPSVSPRLIRA